MFLPENYEAPSTSNNYFKPKDGENRIRILSQPILGWEDWKDNKPVRFKMNNKPMKPNDAKRPIRHFWSFVVFNYGTESIQIMHVTQGTIRKSIEGLCKDKDWGSPYNYDIKITKSGEGMDTEYVVNPVPHKPVDDYIVQCFNETPINLNALFEGTDPFTIVDQKTPLGVETKKTVGEIKKEETGKISTIQVEELTFLKNNCSKEYQSELMTSLSKLKPSVNSLEELPLDLYDRVKSALKKNYDEYQTKLNNEVPF